MQHGLERGMLIRNLVAGVSMQSLTPLDVRVDRPALDRARPDDCDLDREVLKILGPGPPQRLHLRPALDLEDPSRISALDALVRCGVVIRDDRQIDALASRARDQLDSSLE